MPPVTFDVLRDGAIVDTVIATLDIDGNYSFETAAEGEVTIRAKVTHWLAKAQNVNLPYTAALNYSLINGDINGDNKINVLDYIILKANYNKIGVDGQAADLNGDSKINVLDYVILKKNYNKIGE